MPIPGLSANQLVTETDAGTANFIIKSGQSNVTSLRCMTTGEAVIRYHLQAFTGYTLGQLAPASLWASPFFYTGTGINDIGNVLTLCSYNNTRFDPDNYDIGIGGDINTYKDITTPTGSFKVTRYGDLVQLYSTNIGSGFTNGIIRKIQYRIDSGTFVVGSFTLVNGVTCIGIVKLDIAGVRDSTFSTNVGSSLSGGGGACMHEYSSRQILVGGNFTKGVIRFNPTGTLDTAYNSAIGSGFNTGEVSSMDPYDAGTTPIIVIGGNFTAFNGVSANRIVSLNYDGTRNNVFNIGTGFNSQVSTVLSYRNGTMDVFLVGGYFTTYKGLSANRLIALNQDGSQYTAFNTQSGFNGTVLCICQYSAAYLLIGGDFTTYQGVSANKIVMVDFNGSRITSFDIGTGFNFNVNTIIRYDVDRTLVGGYFTSYKGNFANKLIALDQLGNQVSYTSDIADTIAPANVTNVSISNVATTTLTLSWTCSTDNVGIAGYRVFTNGGTTPIDISTTQSSGTLSTNITGLLASTSYYFTVRAYDAAGNTNSGTTSATVSTNAAGTVPATPTGLSAVSIGGNDIQIQWNASSGATDYLLTRSTTSGGTYALIATTTNLGYIDTGNPATTYYYKIQARNATGTSAPSAFVSATTDPIVACFVAGTMITLSSGLQVLIEELAINDILMSEMIEGLADTNDVNELYKWHSADLITSKQFAKIDMIKPVVQDVTWIINGGHLQVTPFHSQLVMRDNVWSFIQVKDIQLGDWLIEDDQSLTEVTSMVLCNDTVTVYPITLSGPHTFYANGVLTHNVKIV
jgi:hypothetical protein